MSKMPIEHYRAYPTVDLPDRTWPSKTIDHAPQWCSVDLRDGNQALINPMTIEQKLELFKLLVQIGFKEIEIGFPAAAQVEAEFLRTLIEENLIPTDVTIQVLTQSKEALIEKTFSVLKGVKKANVHLYNSTSVQQRRIVFNMDRAAIKGIAVQGAQWFQKYAKYLPGTELIYEYSPESFTGTELQYALEVCEAVVDVWKPTPENKIILNLPATVEMSTPNLYADRIEWFCRHLRDRKSVLISVHTHNDRGTGVAASEFGVMAGADRVEGTLFGNGERTGNLDILTMALNLFSQGVDPQLDFSDINHLIEVYQRCTGMTVHERHPYAGKLVYTAFSGSHQDAISKGMKAYESQTSSGIWDVPYLPIDPADVGRTYEAIIRINSQSGKGGVAYIMESGFGYKLPKAMHPEFGRVIQAYTERTGKEASQEEILECFKQEYLQKTQPFSLTHFDVQTFSEESKCETKIRARLAVHGKEKEVTGSGNGPIDAFVKGLRDFEIANIDVLSYEEHALEVGSSSQAAAYIQVGNGGANSYFGVGIDMNISVASIKAIISALNRMSLN